MKDIRKRAAIVFLAFILLVSVMPVRAEAATVKAYRYVTASSLIGRSGPGTNYARKTSFTRGTRLWVVKTKGNWSQVSPKKTSKTYYWVSSSYLSTKNPKSSASGSASASKETAVNKYMYVTVSDTLNGRSGPAQNYAVKASFSRGEKLWIVARNGSWYKAARSKSSKTYYWVSTAYMSKSAPAGASTWPTKEKPVKKYMYVNTDRLNVRKGPGTSYAVVTSFVKGSKVWVTSESDGWYMLSKGYWVSKSYMSQSQPAGTSKVPSIKEMAPLAQKYGKKYGVCPSVILATYIQETGLKANNMTLYHNYFGMSSYGSLKDYTGVTKPAWASYKTETTVATIRASGVTYDTIKVYRSVSDSVEDFCAVMRRHYPALGRTKDPTEEARIMAGYNDAGHIIRGIEAYNLTQYD